MLFTLALSLFEAMAKGENIRLTPEIFAAVWDVVDNATLRNEPIVKELRQDLAARAGILSNPPMTNRALKRLRGNP